MQVEIESVGVTPCSTSLLKPGLENYGMGMETKYPLKIQAIRSKGQQQRLYVYLPLPLAAAINM